MRMRVMTEDSATQPTPETTRFIKGGLVRVDTKMNDVVTSIIMDANAAKMTMINHGGKTYREQVMTPQMRELGAATDTARIRAMGLMPQVTKTSEKRTILGYEATRVLSVQRIPYPSDPATSMVTVTESWISQDPRLMKAYNASIEAMERVMGEGTQKMMALISGDMKGVPLETNTVALQRASQAPVDARAILRDPNPEGLLMRNRMETIDIRLLTLAPALFVVPAGYLKEN
jgi:hypothetical protein